MLAVVFIIKWIKETFPNMDELCNAGAECIPENLRHFFVLLLLLYWLFYNRSAIGTSTAIATPAGGCLLAAAPSTSFDGAASAASNRILA